MKEYIDREALLKGLSDNDPSRMEDYYYNAIANAPTADVVEVRHGEWKARDCISISKRGRTIHYATNQCSVCGKWNGRRKTNYCPNCGAKMDEKRKDKTDV